MKLTFKISVISCINLFGSLFLMCSTSCSQCNSTKSTTTSQYTSQKNDCPCDVETAKFLANIYMLTIPINEEEDNQILYLMLAGHDSILNENSKLIKCVKFIGNNMCNNALQNFIANGSSKENEHDRMTRIGNENGVPPDITEKAWNDMDKSDANVDLMNLGLEFLWLSEVLPSVLEGDNELYFTTGTEIRQTIRQLMRLVNTTYPGVGSIINGIIKDNNAQMYSLVEEQILIYSLWMCPDYQQK